MRVFLLVISILALSWGVSGDGLSESPFFQRLHGEWVGEGELVNAEGEVFSVHEEWRGDWREDGSFAIEGERKWNEEPQSFRWVFSYNAATELHECEYWHTGMEQPIRFEVSLADGQARLSSAMGDSGGELVIVDRFTEDGMEGEVRWTDANGQEVLGGTIEHEKQ